MEEIKASDIMIGNWFSHTNENGTFNIQVEEIRPTGIITTWNGGTWYVEYDRLKPIPLTEDILLKCGFTKHRMSGSDVHFEYSIFLGGEVITIMAIYNAEFSIKMHSNARGVKYLHDIQNKIKAIAKTDLIFKI